MSTAVLASLRTRGQRHASVLRLACVPLVIAFVATAAAGGTTTVQVRSGDTLSAIAVSHHTTVDVLRRLNHLTDTNLILVGETLLIPAAAPRVTHPVMRPPVATTKIVTYVVRSGDTLTAIARQYKVSLPAVAARNHLGGQDLIFVGQRLAIEVPVPVSSDNTFAGRTYSPATVAAADWHRATLAARVQPSKAATRALIVRTAKAFGLDPALALAIGWQESGFQQRVVSPADAIGVMQVVPSTGAYIGSYLVHRRLDLLDPADNITAGVALLAALTRSARLDQAVAGYYQGLGSVLANGEYADTKAYVASVLHLRTVFAG